MTHVKRMGRGRVFALLACSALIAGCASTATDRRAAYGLNHRQERQLLALITAAGTAAGANQPARARADLASFRAEVSSLRRAGELARSTASRLSAQAAAAARAVPRPLVETSTDVIVAATTNPAPSSPGQNNPGPNHTPPNNTPPANTPPGPHGPPNPGPNPTPGPAHGPGWWKHHGGWMRPGQSG